MDKTEGKLNIYNKQYDNNYVEALQELIYRLDDNEEKSICDRCMYDTDYTLMQLSIEKADKNLVQWICDDIKARVQTKRSKDTLRQYLPAGAETIRIVERIVTAIDQELEYRGMPTICTRLEAEIVETKYDDKCHYKPRYATDEDRTIVPVASQEIEEGLIVRSKPCGKQDEAFWGSRLVDQRAKEKLLVLPQVLVMIAPTTTELVGKNEVVKLIPISVPETIEVEDSLGKHKYRLVSTVDAWSDTGGHFFAGVRLKDGWAEANDQSVGIKPRSGHEGLADDSHVRAVMIYERWE